MEQDLNLKKRGGSSREESTRVYSTKELLEETGISEPTLRRWLAEKTRLPILNNAKRDWRGNRLWTREHVDSILNYLATKNQRAEEKPEKGPQESNVSTLPPPSTIGPEDLDHLGIKALKEIARTLNVPRAYSYSKDGLIALLKQMLTQKPVATADLRPAPAFYGQPHPTYEAVPAPPVQPDGPFPIPQRYNENKIRLLYRDTHWLYTYWEVMDQTADRIISSHPGKTNPVVVIRVFDYGPDARASRGFFDLDVASRLGNWYVNTNRPGHAFKASVGIRFSDGTFIIIAESNLVKTPSGQVSWITDEKWMLYHEEFEQLLSRYGRQTPSSPDVDRRRMLKKVREFITNVQPRFEESSGFVGASGSHFFQKKKKRRASANI